MTLARSDEEFRQAFEQGTLAPREFDHRAHLRMAFIYLSGQPFLEACIALRDGLRDFTVRIGRAGLYHETITVACMSLLAERMRRHPSAGWEELLALEPELCDRDLLRRYYRSDTLASAAARAPFILADAARH